MTLTYNVADGHGGSVPGVTQTYTVAATNDAAVLSSASASLTETNAALSTGGQLTVSDVDSPATFVAQSGTAGAYGTFALAADGTWTYVMDGAHNELVGGQQYVETFAVASADGTASSVTVTITGTNDAAVVSSATASLTETNAALSTGGQLTVTRRRQLRHVRGAVRHGRRLRYLRHRRRRHLDLRHGRRPRRAGGWPAVCGDLRGRQCRRHRLQRHGHHHRQQRRGRGVLGDGRLTETNAALSTGGQLTVSDVDSPATFVAQSGTAGAYGTFAIAADGTWTYVMDGAHNELVGGQQYVETFAVASADGTASSVTVTITGTNDAAVVSSATASLTETNAALSTGGQLTVSDVDSSADVRGPGGDRGAYGTFAIASDGTWTYVMDGAHNEFVGGQQYVETFAVASADGTA